MILILIIHLYFSSVVAKHLQGKLVKCGALKGQEDECRLHYGPMILPVSSMIVLQPNHLPVVEGETPILPWEHLVV